MKIFTQIQIVVDTMREVQVAVDKKRERGRERTSTFSWGKERGGREVLQLLGEGSIWMEHVGQDFGSGDVQEMHSGGRQKNI